MSACGTIDLGGFRGDLASQAQNDYPPLQLVKLPFNWYIPASAEGAPATLRGTGGTTYIGQGSVTLNLPAGTAAGDLAIVVLFGNFATIPTATGWAGSNFLASGNGWQGAVLQKTLTSGDIGTGSMTANFTPGSNGQAVIATVVGATSGGVAEIIASTTIDSNPHVLSTSATTKAGDLGIYCAGGATSISPFLPNTDRGTNQQTIQSANLGCILNTESYATPGIQAVTFAQTSGPPTFGEYFCIVRVTGLPENLAGYAPPLNPISLSGPMNFLALVSEAIDEQGQYWQSISPGVQAAAGFIRLNGQGNVWIPVSMLDPLTPGWETANDNYTDTPIPQTGFSGIEAPFGQLDWQPALPTFYSTPNPPAEPPGYLLAIVGVSLGTSAGIGTEGGSTMAIPSSAGPVERLKRAGLIP